MNDPTLRNINILFVLSFEIGGDNSTRDSFDICYITIIEIKDFNALIKNKSFLDQSVKNKQETYKTPIEMSRNDDYTTENFLDFSYHQNYCKLIAIDLSRQTNMSILQQINFTENLEEDDGAIIFFH